MLNIVGSHGDKDDSSYRYKMPAMITKVEGRGNGIKTVLVNVTEVSKHLNVDPAYTTKFFGYELGAQSAYKVKKGESRAVVNGQHQAGDLQKMLDKFIDTFILCPSCFLPEIAMDVKKRDIKIDCAACGHNAPLGTTHRLVSYIIKDHKEKKEKKKAGKTKKEKKKGKKKKDQDQDQEEGEGEEEAKVEAAAAVVVEKKESTKDVVWHTDTSKAAQEERKLNEFKELNNNSETKKTLDEIFNAAGEGLTDSPGVVLKIFMASKENREVCEIVSEIRRLQLARGLDDSQKVKVCLEAMIDMKDLSKVPSFYKKHSELLKEYTKTKQGSLILIGCIEEQVGIIEPRLLPKVALIFQTLYETDVLTEEVLLSWHASPPESSWLSNKDVATKVRANTKMFIDWLKEADEESDEE